MMVERIFFLFRRAFLFLFPSFLTGLGYRDEPVTDANLMGKINEQATSTTTTGTAELSKHAEVGVDRTDNDKANPAATFTGPTCTLQ